MGCKGAIDCLRDSVDARIGLSEQQFGWRQNILPPPQNIKALHNLDLLGKTDKNWQDSTMSLSKFGIVRLISQPFENLFHTKHSDLFVVHALV